jgi:hypothetical protein
MTEIPQRPQKLKILLDFFMTYGLWAVQQHHLYVEKCEGEN